MTAFDIIRAKIETGGTAIIGGPTGTELERRGFKLEMPLWSARALLDKPELVTEIHSDYIYAGAEIIVANTFRTARWTLEQAGYGHLADELPDLAVSLLVNAIEKAGKEGEVVPTGCLAPLIDASRSSYNRSDRELEREHEEHAVRQALAGAELIACETMVTVREAVIALRAARASGMPAYVSFVPTDARHIVSGETLDTAIRAVEGLQPVAIALNCCSVEVMDSALPTLRALTNLPIGAYARMGLPDRGESGAGAVPLTPEEYAVKAEAWSELGVRMIGLCCGANPEYTKAIYERLILGADLEDDDK